MLKSYLTVALRHLTTQKLYSLINVAGLAIGLTCFILIALFVRHELGYDRHFSRAEDIYRISRDFYAAGGAETYLATMAAPAAPLLKEDFPQIEAVARIECCGGGVLALDEESFNENDLAFADNELFDIFDFDWLRGDPARALARPYTIVLTESAAARYFGGADPMGRTLTLDDRAPLEVTGVIRDLPDRTHLRFDMLASLSTRTALEGDLVLESWNTNRYYTYVLLHEGADIAELQSESGDFFERHFEEGSSRETGFTALPLTDIHLRSNREVEMQPGGGATLVYAFSAVAFLILLIACINFTNLATARAMQRVKEVTVRKVVGAERSQIIAQALLESLLLAVLAALVAVALAELALPAYAAFVQRDLALDYGDGTTLLALGLVTLVAGVGAGAYPAYHVSRFRPAAALKGGTTGDAQGAASFRKALVVLQFSISIVLMIATAVVYQQTRFARGLETGLDTERIVVVSGSPTAGLGAQWETLKREWLTHPQIRHATASGLTPGMRNPNALGIRAEGSTSDGRGMPFMFVDFAFFETYGIDVLAGRAFSEHAGTDRMRSPSAVGAAAGAFVLNERAAREFGWTPEVAVGKWLELTGGVPSQRGPVIGVVEDVYLESVRTAIKPMIYLVPPEGDAGLFGFQQASLKLTGADLAETLAFIEAKWAEVVPGQPMQRRFLEEDFDALYRGEERQFVLLTVFSLLAISIACLGLFGLASYATERRTKEIGVRKAVGGSVLDIVRLLTAEFSKPVLLANLAAWPIAYFAMQRWLSSFAYRIDMSPWVYAGSALMALVVAWLAVGVVATRAARAKPIRALRYE